MTRKHKDKYDYPGIINDRPFIQLLVGKKGSGKSMLCCKLLLTSYRFCFDRIIFISPTFRAQHSTLWNQISPEGVEVHEQLTETLVQKLYDELSAKQSCSCKKTTLLVLDDLGEELKKIEPRLINLLVSNSRHYRLSIISLHQKLTQCPTVIRGQVDSICMFGACSYLERECLYKEVSVVERKLFMKMFTEVTEKPHAFLVCSMSREGKLKFYESDFITEVT